MSNLKPGQYYTCCGGSRCVVIAATKDKIMVMRIGQTRNTYIVGHDPVIYKDELQWYHGHYFDCWNGNDDEMLVAASKCYAELDQLNIIAS